MQTTPVVVLDNGASTIKAGIVNAHEDVPGPRCAGFISQLIALTDSESCAELSPMLSYGRPRGGRECSLGTSSTNVMTSLLFISACRSRGCVQVYACRERESPDLHEHKGLPDGLGRTEGDMGRLVLEGCAQGVYLSGIIIRAECPQPHAIVCTGKSA